MNELEVIITFSMVSLGVVVLVPLGMLISALIRDRRKKNMIQDILKIERKNGIHKTKGKF